tara:strand:- start:245 stop:493 length:249 start_codon:yes stop_codon:yes gene_type:complete
MANITIDDKEYDTETLSEEARAQLASLQYVDRQLLELQMRSAAYQTARNGYANALKEVLETGEKVDDDNSANITIPDDLNFD